MNKRTCSQILDHAARDHLAKHTDLAPRILMRIQKGKSVTMQPRVKVIATSLLILLVFVIGSMNIPSVKAAIQRWVGYIPEIGLVGEGQIRMLAEPVSVTRDGITLTVKQMWATPDQTLVQYSVEGWDRKAPEPQSIGDSCFEDVLLRLPEGDLKPTQPQVMIGWEEGYELKAVYPPIPATTQEVTFIMSCVALALPGEAPENWELPLDLVSAPPETTAFPVIEVSTPAAIISTALQTVQPSLSTDGLSLVLDRVVQMDDGYLLYVTIHWENTGLGWIEFPDPTALHLLDANGKEISYDFDFEDTNPLVAAAPPRQTVFVIKTAPIQAAGSLTLVLDNIAANMPTNAKITFDPGPDPKPEQTWELNQDIDVGYGHSLRISRVTYRLTNGAQAWLSFDMESKTGITSASLFDPAHPLTSVAKGGETSTPGPFTSDLYYREPLPTGQLTFDITSILVNLPGHWQTTWAPPAP